MEKSKIIRLVPAKPDDCKPDPSSPANGKIPKPIVITKAIGKRAA